MGRGVGGKIPAPGIQRHGSRIGERVLVTDPGMSGGSAKNKPTLFMDAWAALQAIRFRMAFLLAERIV